MLPKDKLKILHRRWAISLIVALVIITWLHLWTIILYLFMGFLMIAAIMKLIDWITGSDLYEHPDNEQPSNEEKTMWDIFTLNQLFNHHDNK